jgi:hypothetical protein
MRNAIPAPLVLAVFAAWNSGCPAAVVAAPEEVDLAFVKLFPEAVFNEGGELVEMTLKNGCLPEKMTVTVGALPVSPIARVAEGRYTFVAPAWSEGTKAELPLTIACAEHPDRFKRAYRVASVTATLVYDPRLEPAPTIVSRGPTGDRTTVLARLTIVFSRDVDPVTVNEQTIGIEGVEGVVHYQSTSRTATFVPQTQLAYSTEYTAFVRGGDEGVRSLRTSKALKPTLARPGDLVDPLRDVWVFTTRHEGEGQAWVGDVAAAAGFSESGRYKLFSVTGQPRPVGTATGTTASGEKTWTLQSGFAPATRAQK